MKYIVFYIVILLANIIQGITGFAGTILAMPPSLMLVGYDVAKPVLNVLGLLSGVYVFAEKRESVNWSEVKRIILVMTVGILVGFGITSLFEGKEELLYKMLGVFVLFLAVEGIIRLVRSEGQETENEQFDTKQGKNGTHFEENKRRIGHKKWGTIANYGILGLAGIVHGMFVCGGPLLIGYLTKQIKDKNAFRATISTVWIVLNSIILVNDIRSGLWNVELLHTQLVSIPFLLGGMFIGSRICQRMSQRFFLILTYILLFISGCSLLVK